MSSILTLQKNTQNKVVFIFFFLVFLASSISGLCENDQIDINSASKQELIKIVQIGEVRAEQLIELRPFDSLDDLARIKGIGPVYLQKIKDQGLACVIGEEKEILEEEEKEKVEEAIEELIAGIPTESPKRNPIILETIKLNTQNIKTQENTQKQGNTGYIKYGFVGICFLVGVLLLLKKNKLNRTEFD